MQPRIKTAVEMAALNPNLTLQELAQASGATPNGIRTALIKRGFLWKPGKRGWKPGKRGGSQDTYYPPTEKAQAALDLIRQKRYSFREIGEQVGLTGERVRQLALKRLGITNTTPVPCASCGKLREKPTHFSYIPHWLCSDCRLIKHQLKIKTLAVTCDKCGTQWVATGGERASRINMRKRNPRIRQSFCHACGRPGKRTETRPCGGCQKPITRTRWPSSPVWQEEHWFCNRTCWATRKRQYAS